MERINLGLGYEYDPSVVDSLARVLRPQRLRFPPRTGAGAQGVGVPSEETTRRAGPGTDLPASCGRGTAPVRCQCWSVVSSGSGLTRGSPASTK